VSLKLETFRAAHLKGMAEVWNETFAGGPNFVHLTEADLRGRVTEQPSFDPANLLVALRDGRWPGSFTSDSGPISGTTSGTAGSTQPRVRCM
jgi:hypothetical protein